MITSIRLTDRVLGPSLWTSGRCGCAHSFASLISVMTCLEALCFSFGGLESQVALLALAEELWSLNWSTVRKYDNYGPAQRRTWRGEALWACLDRRAGVPGTLSNRTHCGQGRQGHRSSSVETSHHQGPLGCCPRPRTFHKDWVPHGHCVGSDSLLQWSSKSLSKVACVASCWERTGSMRRTFLGSALGWIRVSFLALYKKLAGLLARQADSFYCVLIVCFEINKKGASAQIVNRLGRTKNTQKLKSTSLT